MPAGKRKCPHCGGKHGWADVEHRLTGTTTEWATGPQPDTTKHCPATGKRLVYGQWIYPNKGWHWNAR